MALVDGGGIPVPKPKVPTQSPPRQNAPAVKVYVKPAARKPLQATQAVRFINQQVGSKVVKLTAKKSKAQIIVKRGANEGGGGYTYGQPSNAKEVLRGPATVIKVNTSAPANQTGWEGTGGNRPKRTSQKKFRKTGLLGGNQTTKGQSWSPTVAQTTAHEITHALGQSHRFGHKTAPAQPGKYGTGKWQKKAKQPGEHIMNWSSSEYSPSEVRSIKRKTNPKNIGKPGIPKAKKKTFSEAVRGTTTNNTPSELRYDTTKKKRRK